jgi:hypothetical protein
VLPVRLIEAVSPATLFAKKEKAGRFTPLSLCKLPKKTQISPKLTGLFYLPFCRLSTPHKQTQTPEIKLWRVHDVRTIGHRKPSAKRHSACLVSDALLMREPFRIYHSGIEYGQMRKNTQAKNHDILSQLLSQLFWV